MKGYLTILPVCFILFTQGLLAQSAPSKAETIQWLKQNFKQSVQGSVNSPNGHPDFYHYYETTAHIRTLHGRTFSTEETDAITLDFLAVDPASLHVREGYLPQTQGSSYFIHLTARDGVEQIVLKAWYDRTHAERVAEAIKYLAMMEQGMVHETTYSWYDN